MSVRVNLGLAALVLALGVVFAVLVARDGATAGPGTRSADDHDAAARAAATQVHAFLDVDHTDVDAQMERMLEGTTADFRRQFAGQLRTIKAETERQQSSADATVLRVGLSELTADSATALVAADTVVTSRANAGKPRRVPWRIEVDLVEDEGRWLTAGLRFVN